MKFLLGYKFYVIDMNIEYNLFVIFFNIIHGFRSGIIIELLLITMCKYTNKYVF